MSNSPKNKEQSQLIELTETQQNPGAAKASDFVIGQEGGISERERAALLKEADSDGKSKLGEPIPERNQVPHKTR